MFNDEFGALATHAADLFPADLRRRQNALSEKIYKHVNNGVYRAGFATKRKVHEKAVREIFAALDQLEKRLAKMRYLLGAWERELIGAVALTGSLTMNPLLRDSASGRDWRRATEEQRRAFCAIVRPDQMDEDTLRQALDVLLRGRSESLARLNLSDLVAMVLAADRDERWR